MLMSPKDMFPTPREWAERSYYAHFAFEGGGSQACNLTSPPVIHALARTRVHEKGYTGARAGPITSGLSPYLGGLRLVMPNDSIEQFVRAMRTATLTAPVGTTFQYSNANYAVLGLVIQMVSGEAYGAYIQQHIFDPLQMHESFTSRAEALTHGLTAGYQTFFGAVLPMNAPYHLDTQPAGGLISTAQDMTHYLLAQMNQGRFGTTAVLSPTG